MSEKNKVALSDLMKKQIGEKSSKKNIAKTSFLEKSEKVKKSDNSKDADEEKTEEELLIEAKKESNARAAEYNNAEMIKKMIVQGFVKYTVIACVLAVLAIGIIKFGSAFLAFLNGLLYKMIMSALSH